MDIDRKVKIKTLFQNSSIREKCSCGCRITKLNTNEFTLDKCNNKDVILTILNLMNILKN